MAITAPPIPSSIAFVPPPQMSDIVWAINPETGNYDIVNEFTPPNNQGNLQVIQSKILIQLSTFQGEWQPLPDFGIPLAPLNNNADNPDVLAQIITSQILSVQNVNAVDITSLEYSSATRQFAASFSVNTLFGVTQVVLGV